MSVAGNIAKLRWAKQTAMGSVASASVFGSRVISGMPKPVIVDEDFVETTGQQMVAARYRSMASGGGDVQAYVRPAMIGSWLYGVLGAVATTGAGDPYTHVVTPATSLPWWTFWRQQGNLIWERFPDCKITKLVIHGEAFKPLTATATIMGLKAQGQNAEETTVNVELGNEFMHSNATGALLLEGAAVASIDQFDLTIDRGGANQGGDSLFPIDISEGNFAVTLAIRRLLLTASLKNRLGYGTATPNNTDVVNAVLALAGSPAGAQFTFTRVAVNRILTLALPNVVVQPYDVDPATSSDPLRESVTLQALDDGSTVPITATIKNARPTVY